MCYRWIFGDKSSLTLLCKSPPPGLSLAWYVLQGADQTRLSVGQTFGSLSLIRAGTNLDFSSDPFAHLIFWFIMAHDGAVQNFRASGDDFFKTARR